MPLPDTLELKADLSSLRQSADTDSEAFVMADVVDLPYAPRTVLKNTKWMRKDTKNIKVDLKFSVNFEKL